jgi:hypothetical protein
MSCSKFLLVVAGVCLAAPAVAGESPFGHTYTTDTHPKGKREIEQWITRRHGQAKGDFHLWQGRTEFEYDRTDRLQTALYLNYDRVNALRNRPDETTGPGEWAGETHFWVAVGVGAVFGLHLRRSAPA